jgi:hypothetical protein
MKEDQKAVSDRLILHVSLEKEEAEIIGVEAQFLQISMAKLLKDYCLQYVRFKEEAVLAAEGMLAESVTAFADSLSKEARLAVLLDRMEKKIDAADRDHKMIINLISTFIKIWYNHTEEVPQDKRPERSKLTEIRFGRFLKLIASSCQQEDTFITQEINRLIEQQLIEG